MALHELTPPAVLFIVGLALYLIRVAFFSKKITKLLDKEKAHKVPLIAKTRISHNTALYRFALPSVHHILGLPVGQHIVVHADIDGDEVTRSYTPTTLDTDEKSKGFFDLLIKTYDTGVMSQHFAQLKIGDTIAITGPKGQFLYKPGCVSRLGMIAGGTGITPMYQIILAILENSKDKTKIDLIFGNVNEEDILLREHLESLAQNHSDQLRIHYVLNNKPNDSWTGGVGFVTKDMINEYLPPVSDKSSKILLCGPYAMVQAMKKNLTELGYPKGKAISKMVDQVFTF